MELKLDKVPLDVAVRDIEKFVQGEDGSVNVGIMQTRIYFEIAKLLKEVIESVSATGRDMEDQKFDIPILWISAALKNIGKEEVTLQELFPSEWLNVVTGLVHHELYAEHTGVNTELERHKIVYGIVGEMSGTADATMYEVKSKWLDYDSEWETNREDVLKVVGVLSGPDTAPDTPGSIESINETCEMVGLALGIPTVVDMRDLRDELGYSATPEELLETYNANRDKYSKYVVGSNEVAIDPAPVVPTETVSTTDEDTPPITPVEPSNEVSIEEGSSILDDMLEDAERGYKEAVRENIKITEAAAKQIKNAELNTADIEAKIERLNSTTPSYYGGGGGGGGSSEWTTGEVILGVAAVAAIGAVAWYGYNKLTSDEYDIPFSDLDIPDTDFDFDSGFDF